MKDYSFNFLWESLILKRIDELYQKFDSNEINKFNIEIKNREMLKKNLIKEYDIIRKSLKRKYYYKGDSLFSKIDNHKIAACFCKSLINEKAFTFSIAKEISDELFLINYRLAYEVSLGVVYFTLIDYYISGGEKEIADKLIEQNTLLVPNTTEGHDDYHTGRIKTLALNDMYGNNFDLLTYSDMMFWIEYYNKQILEDKIKV